MELQGEKIIFSATAVESNLATHTDPTHLSNLVIHLLNTSVM
jgi:hypothetical protein